MAASRKSLRTQLDEVLAEMSELSREEKPDKAKVGLLTSRLETIRYLHAQENAAETEKLKQRIAELESATTQSQTTSPSNDVLLDAQVAAMLQRHNAGMTENKPTLQLPVRVPTLTRDEPAPRSALALVEYDPDLLT